jgi:hypothetical protein
MKSVLARINFTSAAELIEESQFFRLPIVSLILAAIIDKSFLNSERNRPRLTNNHVVKLAGSPLPESVVVRVIRVYDSEFDTSICALLTLKRKGVSDQVIAAMLSKEFTAAAS